MSEPRIHAVIPTHTPRYLELVLAGLSRQTLAPASITVACDSDDESIGKVIERSAVEFGLVVHWVRRAHHGMERLCQTRNNAVRYISESLSETSGRVLVLDGDMLASQGLVEMHALLGAEHELVYAYRVNLGRVQSESLRAEKIGSGEQTPEVPPDQLKELRKRHKRYARHLLLRKCRLAPQHKPKLLGGHFSCDLDLYLKLNGFDEEYQGWGFKDDEFARRAAKLGARVALGVDTVIAWHLWHETRQPEGRMAELPTARRFARKDLPVITEHGVRNPLDQHEILSTRFGG
jgi:hypothetical protein